MPAPVVADLEAEECLVSSLLLHDQHEVFGAIENDALWFIDSTSCPSGALIRLYGSPGIWTWK